MMGVLTFLRISCRHGVSRYVRMYSVCTYVCELFQERKEEKKAENFEIMSLTKLSKNFRGGKIEGKRERMNEYIK